jgi:hypothetical protein
MTYMDLFVYRMVASHADPSYYTKIGIEAKEFYKYSDKTYERLGNSVFSDVYSVV